MTDRCSPLTRAPRAAFTLIELLAVIVIVSLTIGLVTISLAATGERAYLRATVAQWRDLDARARAFARSLGSITMRLDQGSHAVQLHRDQSGELLTTVHLPQDLSATLGSEEPSHTIIFDRLGRSPDYDVKLLAKNNRTIHWHVCGLTGWITEGQP